MAKTRRSLQDILDNADALAKRFTDADLDSLDWKPTGPLARVGEAVQARAAAERDLLEAVTSARGAGATWSDLGKTLGYIGRGGAAEVWTPSAATRSRRPGRRRICEDEGVSCGSRPEVDRQERRRP